MAYLADAALARGSAEQKFTSLSVSAFDRDGFIKTIASYAKVDVKLVVIVRVYAIGSGCGCQYYTLCVPTRQQWRGSAAAAWQRGKGSGNGTRDDLKG